jgi:hypothetical protein
MGVEDRGNGEPGDGFKGSCGCIEREFRKQFAGDAAVQRWQRAFDQADARKARDAAEDRNEGALSRDERSRFLATHEPKARREPGASVGDDDPRAPDVPWIDDREDEILSMAREGESSGFPAWRIERHTGSA